MTNPLKALLAGIGGTLLFGFFTIYLFLFAERPLSSTDIEIVRGNLADSEVLRPSRGSDALQIWLTNQTIPFRGNAGYPKYYRKEALARLTNSAGAEIGVLPSDRQSPRRDRLHGQDFVPIRSLTVEGVRAFTLDDYNQWKVENQRTGRFVAPALLICSLLSLGYGLRHRRRISP